MPQVFARVDKVGGNIAERARRVRYALRTVVGGRAAGLRQNRCQARGEGLRASRKSCWLPKGWLARWGRPLGCRVDPFRLLVGRHVATPLQIRVCSWSPRPFAPGAEAFKALLGSNYGLPLRYFMDTVPDRLDLGPEMPGWSPDLGLVFSSSPSWLLPSGCYGHDCWCTHLCWRRGHDGGGTQAPCRIHHHRGHGRGLPLAPVEVQMRMLCS